MNWLNKLEGRFGKYAIRNLPLYIALCYGVGAVLNIASGGTFYTQYLSLNPYLVLHGQPWRLVTFLIATPESNIIFLIFMLLFYYSLGESLVHVWGAFRFNMYVLTGILGTILASFIVYFIQPSPYIFMDTYYLNMSIFLAFAAIFPDMQIYLYAIIPIRVKWLALIYAALMVYEFITGDIGAKVCIVVSMMNFFVFFLSSRDYKKISPKEVRRRRDFRKKAATPIRPGTGSAGRHQCAVCKRTDVDNPQLEFRYCSKCNGSYEYCNDHLFTHTHVR